MSMGALAPLCAHARPIQRSHAFQSLEHGRGNAKAPLRPVQLALRVPPPKALRPVQLAPRVPPPKALPGSEQLPLDEEVKGELPQWLTLVGYAGALLAEKARIGSFHLSASHIYTALSWYTVAWAAINLLDKESRGQYDTVGSVVGPAFLGINAVNGFGGRVAPFEAAAFLFGFQWLDKLPTFQYSRWAWLATLLAAIYKGYAAQWLVGAFGLSAAWKLAQEQDLKQLAFLGLAFWAFYKHVETPVALVLMGAQIVASAVV